MYILFNSKQFGNSLRKLREERNLTRKKVEENCFISSETLRKIESGNVIPRFETIQILSSLYKVDLLRTLSDCRNENIINEINMFIDRLFIENSTSTSSLQQYSIVNSQLTEYSLIELSEVDYFNTLLLLLPKSNSTDDKVKQDVINQINYVIKKYKNDFSKEHLERYEYTYLEMRLLYLSSIVHAELKDYSTSNIILNYLMNKLQVNKHSHEHLKMLYIKVLCNIAYNHHIYDNHVEVLNVVNLAITFFNENNTIYLLEVILFRKLIAEYNLKLDEYSTTLSFLIQLLNFKSLDEQLKLYKKILKEKYNIIV